MVKPLINGFQSFRNNYFDKERKFFNRLTTRGQKPKIMVIAIGIKNCACTDCSNSNGSKPPMVVSDVNKIARNLRQAA